MSNFRRTKIGGILAYWNMFCCECGGTENVCFSKKHNKPLCQRHYMQMKRRGFTLENTRADKNKYKVSDCGSFAHIYLYDKFSEKIGETIVDIEDLEKCLQYRIHLKSANRVGGETLNYAIAKVGDKNIKLHELIIGEKYIDHKSNDGLDNRKGNLRNVSISQNGMNRRLQSNNSTGVCGVVSRDHNNTSPWIPMIKLNGKTTRLGTEYSFDEAVKKRLIAIATYFKEYSNNFNPLTQTIQLTYLSHDDQCQTFIEVSLQGELLQFKKL
jgi:hypothetical protein